MVKIQKIIDEILYTKFQVKSLTGKQPELVVYISSKLHQELHSNQINHKFNSDTYGFFINEKLEGCDVFIAVGNNHPDYRILEIR